VVKREEVDFIDVSTNQAFSIATSMIPFLNHDDANEHSWVRTCKSRQPPCIIPEAPLVATGIEEKASTRFRKTCDCRRSWKR